MPRGPQMMRAVLDANVFVSALLRPEGPPGRILESFLREESFELVLSPAIAGEVMAALSFPKVRRLLGPGVDPLRWFEDLAILSDLVPGDLRVAGACRDPDDDKYLAAALEGRASLIVTGDDDLLSLRWHEGVRIVSPREFVDLLST